MQRVPHDLVKTKIFLHKAVASAGGWDLNVSDEEVAIGPLLYLYVHDCATNKSFAGGVSLTEYHRIVKKVRAIKPAEWSAIRDYCGGSIRNYFDKGPLFKREEGLNAEEALCMGLVTYSATTQTWESAKGFKEGGHFIVIAYKSKEKAGDVLMRPFATASSKSALMTVEEFYSSIDYVKQHDKQKNHHWF